MKRIDLIRAIEGCGCEFVRHGGKHDWYRNPTTGVAQPVPRHREIKDGSAPQVNGAFGRRRALAAHPRGDT